MRPDPRKNRNEHKHVREISAEAGLRERLDGDSIEQPKAPSKQQL
jgi:hypothetical protein